jgi:MFS family permease
MTPRSLAWTTAALAAAAASTTTLVPSLRRLSEDVHGVGAGWAGAFVAVHVLGGLAGAGLFARCLGRQSCGFPARRTGVGVLLASSALHAAMAVAPGFAALLAMRAVEGAGHVIAVMLLMGAGAAGERQRRSRRMTGLGAVLVLGVGLGLGLGGALAGRGTAWGFLASALLALFAAAAALRALPERFAAPAPSAAPAPAHAAGDAFTPAILAAGERFVFGVLSVAVPLGATSVAESRAAAAVLGTFMLVAVAAMPLTAFATRGRAPRSRRRLAAVWLVAALVAAAVPGVLDGLASGLSWALLGGAGAAAVYAACLDAVAGAESDAGRSRAVGLMHAAGGAGYAFGSFAAGFAMSLSGATPGPVVAGAALVFGLAALAAELGPARAVLSSESRETR